MKCAVKVSRDVEQFMQDAGLDEAFLFGGAVLDPLLNPDAKVNDYDLCVRSEDAFYEALSQLERKNIDVSDVMRTHNIYAVVRHPQLGQIDLSCMDPEDNGIFNVEKIYARFKRKNGVVDNVVIDKFGAVDSMRSCKIRLASTPEKEGAYNILRRFLAISGKYNLDISKGGVNQEAVDQINKAFDAGYRFIPQDKVRCLSRLVASLKRSQDRKKYVKDIAEQNILARSFPDVHKLFQNEMFQNCDKLQDCSSQKELLELMLANVDFRDRDAMIDCLMQLSRREKARQDKGVNAFIEAVSDEKTSAARLNKSILSPLFAHIAAGKNARGVK